MEGVEQARQFKTINDQSTTLSESVYLERSPFKMNKPSGSAHDVTRLVQAYNTLLGSRSVSSFCVLRGKAEKLAVDALFVPKSV